jgi:serine/threonine-protein kinase
MNSSQDETKPSEPPAAALQAPTQVVSALAGDAVDPTADTVAIPTGDRPRRLPAEISGYRVDTVLGYGGMGEVFQTHDPVLDRPVALKRIRAANAKDAAARARFILEARITARLQHPAIIPVYHFSEHEQDVFYTMRPVAGLTMAEQIDYLIEHPEELMEEWTVAHQVRLFLQALSAVAYAHANGIVHRDLKPANIMVGPFEEVVVLDWGVAKTLEESEANIRIPTELRLPDPLATGPHAMVGTPRYMAPEQLEGQPASVQSDVFALGVTLYELLALQPPWRGDTVRTMLEAMQSAPACPTRLQPARDIPQRLVDVLWRALAPEPADRYHEVNAFAHDLAHALEGRAAWMRDARTRHWRLVEGYASTEEDYTILRSRGRRNLFHYACRGSFTGNLRFTFDFMVSRGQHVLGVLLNAPVRQRTDDDEERGYRINVVGGRSRSVSLGRQGRDVTGAVLPAITPKRWYRVTVLRVENRLSLIFDGEEVYSYTDPIPLRGGGLALIGRSSVGVRLRNLRVDSQGVGATVSCLSVPDAFFNRSQFDDARDEYVRIATSLSGRREGRDAAFRAGLCLVHSARRESDSELREMLLEDAGELIEELFAPQPSCMAELGRAMVAVERGDYARAAARVSFAVRKYPDDPQLSSLKEWLLSSLHRARPAAQRRLIVQLLPVALKGCREGWGARALAELVRDIRRGWEFPGFLNGRFNGKLSDPVCRAELLTYVGFLGAQPDHVHRALDLLADDGSLSPSHAADAAFAFIELGLVDAAAAVLDRARSCSGDLDAPALVWCESAVTAALGDPRNALSKLQKHMPNGQARIFNGARLIVARSLFEAGATDDARRCLRPRGVDDRIAHERRAWLALLRGNADDAVRALKPLVEADAHCSGRDMSNFLYGAAQLMAGKRRQAKHTFEMLPATDWPRTWTLGSYAATERLPLDGADSYLDICLPWERRQLYEHQAIRVCMVCGGSEHRTASAERAIAVGRRSTASVWETAVSVPVSTIRVAVSC